MVGVGPESGDLNLPALEKIAWAYGLPNYSIRSCVDRRMQLTEILTLPRPMICEVFAGTMQPVEPKVSFRQTFGGQTGSLPLEDTAPFLPRNETENDMQILLTENSRWSE